MFWEKILYLYSSSAGDARKPHPVCCFHYSQSQRVGSTGAVLNMEQATREVSKAKIARVVPFIRYFYMSRNNIREHIIKFIQTSKMMDFDDQISNQAPNPYAQNQPQIVSIPDSYQNSYGISEGPSYGETEYSKEPQIQQKDDKADQKEPETGLTRFCKQRYYQQFFKVTEKNVIERVLAAVMPPFNDQFIDLIKPNPDFYGPFWILTTIIFLLGIVGNFANYMLSKFSDSLDFEGYFFKLELVRYAFVMVYTFGLGVPLTMLVLFKFLKCNQLTLPELLCLYGYSMACYIPALLLCILPLTFLQWLAMSYAFINSTFFLCLSLKKYTENKKKLVIVGAIVAALNLTFFLCGKLIFISLMGVEKDE